MTATAPVAAAVTAATATGWWMYHGNPEHTGLSPTVILTLPMLARQLSACCTNCNSADRCCLCPRFPTASSYVGLANYQNTPDGSGNGGALHKIDIQAGTIVKTFSWNLGGDMEDTHSFTGMGSTPMLTSDRVLLRARSTESFIASIKKRSSNSGWLTSATRTWPTINR